MNQQSNPSTHDQHKSITSQYLTYVHGYSPLETEQNTQHYQQNINTIKQPLQQLLNGEPVNQSEKQAVTHHQNRTPAFRIELDPIIACCNDIHHQKITINDTPIKNVCQIGIGGSTSGPQAIHQALITWGLKPQCNAYFISNHDNAHIAKTISNININETLFIIASKSGTTIEIQKIIDTIIKTKQLDPTTFFNNQCITITTQNSPLDNDRYLECFFFKPSIGGRYSTTSIVGLFMLGITFGSSIINNILDGAYAADTQDLNCDTPLSSIALNQAILNIAYRNTHQLTQLALVPYGEAFTKLPEFLTQLISESLGKSVTNTGKQSTTNNCPHIIHGIGPDAQHSFFQQLHQAKPITPCEFIFAQPSTDNQHHLLQQICGQMTALHEGAPNQTNHNHFSGNRPSTLLMLNEKTPQALGALIATYENRVMFEALLLDINAFDQPGVELGKTVTQSISDTGDDLGSQLYRSILTI